jgi:diguanylate cyclase (GGDEF)-like protein
MFQRISTLVVIGFSVLLALGLGTSFFLYQTLQQRVDEAAVETLLLNQTRVRVREAQVDFLMMAQQVSDILLDPAPDAPSDGENGRMQQAHEALEDATMHTRVALAASHNAELKKTLQKLIDHARQVVLPLGDKILWLATIDLNRAKTIYGREYLPAQAENMALVNEAIRLSSEELRSFSENANAVAAQALNISRITFTLFACLGLGIAIFIGRAVARLEQELHVKADYDSLTGLLNRGTIIDILRKAMARRERKTYPLSVIFADLDHFKETNDNYGHQAGDEVLREVAYRGAKALRPYDSFGRYGGEEFVIVLPDCGVTSALAVAERVRSAIADQPVSTTVGAISTSLSLGVAVADGETHIHVDGLIQLADDALYRAKDNGRNRVVCAEANSIDSSRIPLP